ncbi:hypothetical protein LX36DRAFT_269056 [Colletotrichum falcatum]|nr:hypothetical protein LX36DRAFT_269056 [Colletotrichum falcatum]
MTEDSVLNVAISFLLFFFSSFSRGRNRNKLGGTRHCRQQPAPPPLPWVLLQSLLGSSEIGFPRSPGQRSDVPHNSVAACLQQSRQSLQLYGLVHTHTRALDNQWFLVMGTAQTTRIT